MCMKKTLEQPLLDGNYTQAAAPDRLSTIAWIKDFLLSEAYHWIQLIYPLQSFLQQKLADSTIGDGDDDDDPVNIMILGGGGLRGYAHNGVLQGLLELNDGDDFLQFFDLAGGTSVGGCCALLGNHFGVCTREGLQHGEDILDDVFRTTFLQKSWQRIFTHGSMSDRKTALASVYRRNYGDVPLYKPGNLKAFALAAVKEQSTSTRTTDSILSSCNSSVSSPNPYILRTYDVPDMIDDDDDDHDAAKTCTLPVCAGSSTVRLWEAMAATSAAPLLADRIVLHDDDDDEDDDSTTTTTTCADGGVIANNPFVVGILEALRLWPRRKLGVVVMLTLDGHCPWSIRQAVRMVQKAYPDTFDFVCLSPPVAVHALLETQEHRLRETVRKAKAFTVASQDAQRVMRKLKTCRKRCWWSEQSSVELRIQQSDSVVTWGSRHDFCCKQSPIQLLNQALN